jgi:sulfide:quinone oxidoreductase
MKLQQLDEHIYIADQINTVDISTLKELGIKTIINNRPDNEEAKQPLSADISVHAASINIKYYFLPIIPGNYSVGSIEKLTELLNTVTKPVLIFCRTGNRSINLWALSQSPIHGKEYVSAKAKEIGFDI